MSDKTDRSEPRVMLALIALAVDLPVPSAIRYINDHILSLYMDRLADGQAWSAHLGGRVDARVSPDGHRYLDEGLIDWHGWSVMIHANELVAPDSPLDGDTTTRLRAVAEEGGDR